MKPRYLLTSALAAAITTLAACDKGDILDVTSPTTISDDNFWTAENDAVLFLNGTYSVLPSANITVELDGITDNGTVNAQFDEKYVFADGSFDPLKSYSNNRWNDFYNGVARANMILANIDRIPALRIDANRKARYIAEAKFLRGYFYLWLVNLFGDVPMPLAPLTDAQARQLTRTPAAQVYDQILKDFDEAAAVLPTSYSGTDVGRATKGAALAYKARAALYAARWQIAADAAKAVIDMGTYSLYNNYQNLFLYAGENNSEIIFTRKYSKATQATGQTTGMFGTFGPPGNSSASHVVPIRDLVDHYQTTDGQTIATSPLYNPAWNLMYNNRDPRLGYTILHPGSSWDGITFDSRPLPLSTRPEAISLQDVNRSVTGYNLRKHLDLTDKTDRGNGGIDIILMRYADVLLMYAEAKVMLGQGGDAAAVAALNAVRQRPTVNMPPVTGPLTEAHIRYERRAELAFEGLRLFDIRRWKIGKVVQTMPVVRGIDYINAAGVQVTHTVPASARAFGDEDYLWPIPQPERDKNKLLTQNPGF